MTDPKYPDGGLPVAWNEKGRPVGYEEWLAGLPEAPRKGESNDSTS